MSSHAHTKPVVGLLTLLLLLLVGPAASQVTNPPQTYFVAPNGSNGNPGTIALPFQTIAYALRKASQPGDIIYLRSGVYALKSSLRFPHDGSELGGAITLASYPPDIDRAVLDGGSLPSNARAMLDLSGRRFIRIEGLELRNMNKSTGPHAMVLIGDRADNIRLDDNIFRKLSPFNGYQGSGRALACLAGPSRTISQIEIHDNEFFECLTGQAPLIEFAGQVRSVSMFQNLIRDNDTQAAILLRQPAKLQAFAGLTIGTAAPEDLRINSNVIQRNVDQQLGGRAIWIAAGNAVVVERNRLTDNWIAIELAGSVADTRVQDIRIESNFIEGSSYQGLAFGGPAAPFAASVERIQVLNNTLYNNGRAPGLGTDPGSLVFGEAGDLRLIGNLIVAASGGLFSNIAIARVAGTSNPGLLMLTNLYWTQNGQEPKFEPLEGIQLPGLPLWQAVTGQDLGSLQANPQLSLPSVGNLKITSSSPARDAALTLTGTYALTDFFFQPRPDGAFADIGAHEF
jgi:hypothetical protein